MHLLRIVCGGVFLAVAGCLFSWALFAPQWASGPGHPEKYLSLWVGGSEFAGWPLWVFLGLVILIGALFVFAAVRMIRSQTCSA